jgi:hypothetical protein
MSDPNIIMSPFCREISRDGTTIQVEIYRGADDSGWILEVVDEENASTVWDEPFDNDSDALDAVLKIIEREGIRSFLEGGTGVTY